MSAVFKQPYIEKGMTVQWFINDGNFQTFFGAVVLAIGQSNTIDALVFYPEGNTLLREGVRHKTDPRNKDANAIQREDGVWDHTDFTKRVLSIVNDLNPPKTDKKV